MISKRENSYNYMTFGLFFQIFRITLKYFNLKVFEYHFKNNSFYFTIEILKKILNNALRLYYSVHILSLNG